MHAKNVLGKHDPRRTSIEIHGHQLRVNGRPIPIRGPDNPQPRLLFKGYYYENEAELQLAKLLYANHIRALHHPRFTLHMPDGTVSVWSPDFIFLHPQLFEVSDPKRQLLIHGMELKNTSADPGVLERRALLVEQHNVHIQLIFRNDLERFVATGSVGLQRFVE